MRINTERLLLRNFSRGDVADVFEYCSQEGVGEMAGWPAHKAIDETEKMLDEWINNKNIFAIVWKKNGKVIGHLAVNADSEENRDDTRELGCALNRNYQRRGIMTEAIRAVLGCFFTNGIAFIWACCFQNNAASKGMIEKCGFSFQQEGTFYAKRLDKTFPSYEYRMTREEWRRCHVGQYYIKMQERLNNADWE